MRYCIFVDELYEAWLEEYDTLEEANASLKQMSEKLGKHRPRLVLMEKIAEVHYNG